VIDVYDVMALIGLGMLATGLWMVSPVLSLSVVGGILLAGGVFGSAFKARDRVRKRKS
jgi:hypothetical protein